MLFLLLRRLGGHTLRRPDSAKLMASLLQNETRTDIPAEAGGIASPPHSPLPYGATVRVASQASSGTPCHKLRRASGMKRPPASPQPALLNGILAAPAYGLGSRWSAPSDQERWSGGTPQERAPVRTVPQAATRVDGSTPQLARVLFQKRHAKADSRTPASP